MIVALEDNSTLDIMIDKHLTTVAIPRGSMIIFDSASAHSGSANNSEFVNTRIHCKLKKSDIELNEDEVVEYYTCKYGCGEHKKSKKAIWNHHRDCKLCPNYENRRICKRKADKKYQLNKKKLKEMEAKDSDGKKEADQSYVVADSNYELEEIQRIESEIESNGLTQKGDFKSSEAL